MTVALRARIGDLTFWQGRPPVREPFAFVFTPTGFKGWDDPIAQRRTETTYPNSAGSFDSPGYGVARVISFTGYAIARTPGDLVHAGDRFAGLLADGSLGRLVVTREDEDRWADVRLAASATPAFVVKAPSRTAADFTIQFWAPDPRKYGITHQFGPGSNLTLWHYGNAQAYPILTITGSLPTGYTIDGPNGLSYSVTQALTSGQTHTIDMRTGILSLNGVAQFGVSSVADLWTVPPGARQTNVFVPASGSGQLSASVVDTFL